METAYKKLSKERKDLQASGLLPEWFTTAGWQLFKSKYLWASTPLEQYRHIASTLARHSPDPDYYETAFMDITWSGYFSYSTPVLSNCGTDRGLIVSCAGQYVEDSIDGFYSGRREAALLSKHGFGTSAYLGDIRPRGSPISTGGKAAGALPVLKGFMQDSREVSQGGVRRGSFAGYFPMEHGDFWEVVEYLEAEPDGLNIGWCVSDEFLRRLEERDSDAMSRFSRALKTKLVTGKGYFWFVDKANRALPEYYPITNKASNLCVTGDQLVVTSDGLMTAEELYLNGNELVLWNNKTAVEASSMRLVESGADVYKITLANGMTHTVTDYHKVLTERGDVEVAGLTVGDRVAFQTEAGLYGALDMEDEAFLTGLYQADGTSSGDIIHLCLWEKDFDLEQEVQRRHDAVSAKYKTQVNVSTGRVHNNATFREVAVRVGSDRKRVLSSKALTKALAVSKGHVPSWVFQGTEATQWQYVRGLFYADGTVNVTGGKGSPFYLSITNINKEFLQELQILLANLGINTSLSLMRPAGEALLPDGNGGKAYYDVKDAWRLVCGNKPDGLRFEKHTGFLSRKAVKLEDREYRDNTKKFSRVVGIEYAGKQDVYCCTVHDDTHHWVCNGIITHNCSEILLPADSEHSFTCVLGSMNLSKYDEWKDTDAVHVATVLLDCVVSEFLERARGVPGLEKAVAFTEKARAIGLGVMGFHTYLQQRRIPFGSLEAVYVNQEIFEKLLTVATRTTRSLAEKLGAPEWGKGEVRNCSLLAVAPTKSTSLIMGGVSEGINPDPAMVYTQDTAGGEVLRTNPVLLGIMKDRKVYNRKVLQELTDSFGSVQGVDWLSDEEKQVFKTAFEIDQNVVVRLASQRGAYIDQWQSLNLFFSAEEDPAVIVDVHRTAFNDPRILGLYYVYSKSGVAASKDRTDYCEACVD